MSYNRADADVARTIGALLLTQDITVWLDEWRIGAGDSIVHEVNVGLDRARGIIVVWSARSAESSWVKRELAAAVQRATGRPPFKIIPVILDDTPLPVLIRDLKYVDWRTDRSMAAAQLIGGIRKRKADRRTLLRGINDLLEEINAIPIEHFGIVACPHCGGEHLEPFMATDYRNDRSYRCVRCLECGWRDSDEV